MATTLTPHRGMFPSLWREPRRGLLDEMEHLVGRIWDDAEDGWFVGRNAPSVDISETDNLIEATIDLPGVKPEEIDIQLNGNLLTVSGERKEAKEDKGKTYHRVERHSGSFSRSFPLPSSVNEDKVAAEFHDGVLTITLPKTEESKTHRVEVKS